MHYFRSVTVLMYWAVNRPSLFLLFFDSGIHQPMKACDYLRFVEHSSPTQKAVFLEPSISSFCRSNNWVKKGFTQISLQDEACTSWCPLWGGNRLIHFLNSNISPLKRWIRGKSWSCSPTTSSSRSPSPAWSSSAGGTVWCLSILLEGCTTIIRLSYSWATEYMLFLL